MENVLDFGIVCVWAVKFVVIQRPRAALMAAGTPESSRLTPAAAAVSSKVHVPSAISTHIYEASNLVASRTPMASGRSPFRDGWTYWHLWFCCGCITKIAAVCDTPGHVSCWLIVFPNFLCPAVVLVSLSSTVRASPTSVTFMR